MSVDSVPSSAADVGPETTAFRDADGYILTTWLDDLRGEIGSGHRDDVLAQLEPLYASDIGDAIEQLEPEERIDLMRVLGEDFDFAWLTEVDESIRVEMMEAIPNAEIARAVAEMDHDDAVYLLEDLEQEDQDEILRAMPTFERLALKRSLDYPEDSAGRRMQTEFIAIPPFWTVGQTIDYLRAEPDLPDDFYQLYVVDASYKVLGVMPLDRFLRTQRSAKIDAIMNTKLTVVKADDDQEEAARSFERYDLIEVGVVDDNDRLVGVLTIDDIVDVIQEEAEEDIRLMAGVGDEDVSDTTGDTVKSRTPWLVVNLFTALFVSLVIGLFNATIEQMVALAALMPIVASMGGNAGSQTMTVTVRALAMRELDGGRLRRLIRREMVVGLVNGVIFALLIGVITAFRYGNPELGVVIGSAMVINMVVAGTFGVLVPLTLNKLKADPAIASAVFVTTITDVIGFFAFLGIAGLWFGLF